MVDFMHHVRRPVDSFVIQALTVKWTVSTRSVKPFILVVPVEADFLPSKGKFLEIHRFGDESGIGAWVPPKRSRRAKI